MDYCPWTQSMPSRDVNAATRLAEASWRRDNMWYMTCLACRLEDGIIYIKRYSVEGKTVKKYGFQLQNVKYK